LKVVKKQDFKGYTSSAPDDIKVIQSKMGDVVKLNSWKMIYAKDDTEFNQIKQEMIDKCKALGSDIEFAWEKSQLASALKKAAKYK
jgi:putative aldouronate transport system substrate-binding protein